MALTIFETMEQSSPEWLEARRGIVTASTVGKLLTSTGKVANNETSRTLTETLAIERITGRIEYTPPTRDMQRGTLLEPEARSYYESARWPVKEIGFMRLDGHGRAIGYSPDGLVGKRGLIEIKSRTPRIHINTIRADRVPAANMAQLQTGLLVSGRSWIDYVSYSPGLPLYVKRVTPDGAWFAAISEAVEQFETNVAAFIAEYEAATRDLRPTDWWDPFDTGEEIY